MAYLSKHFSLNMIPLEDFTLLRVRKVTEVPQNAVTVENTFSLTKEDVLYVEQSPHQYIEITVKPEGCKNCPGFDCNTCSVLRWTHGY